MGGTTDQCFSHLNNNNNNNKKKIGKTYSDTESYLRDSTFSFLGLWLMFNFKELQRVELFICIKFQKQMITVFFNWPPASAI